MRSRRSGALGAVVALVAMLAVPAAALAVSPRLRAPHPPAPAKPYFDSRAGAAASGRVSASERAARRGLSRSLGPQAVVDVDRVTGTVRWLQKLDGALSGPAAGDRGAVALDWVRANRAALG